MSVAAGSPVLAIVRVRLAPRLPWQAFEQWLRAIPTVLHAGRRPRSYCTRYRVSAWAGRQFQMR